VLRTDRFRNADREVSPAAGGNGVAVRRAPGWFDLTVAIEAGGDQLAAAESIERLLAATMRTGDLATTLELGGEYPVYASIDTPTIEELQTWLQNGLIRRTGGVLRAVVTVAVQPFEPSRVDIVRTRRIHTDDMRTKARETVQR
jgi:hypothetical protein